MKNLALFIVLFVFGCKEGKYSENHDKGAPDSAVVSDEDKKNVNLFEGYKHIEKTMTGFMSWYIPFMDTLQVETGYAPDQDNGMYIINKDEYLKGLESSGFVSKRLIQNIKAIYDQCETADEGEYVDRLTCLDGEPFVSDFNKKKNLLIIYKKIEKESSTDGIIVFVELQYDVPGPNIDFNTKSDLTFTFKEIDGQWLIDSTSEFDLLEKYDGIN